MKSITYFFFVVVDGIRKFCQMIERRKHYCAFSWKIFPQFYKKFCEIKFQIMLNSRKFLSIIHDEKTALQSVEKWKIYSHWKNISSNQLFRIFFSKNVTFARFSVMFVYSVWHLVLQICRKIFRSTFLWN